MEKLKNKSKKELIKLIRFYKNLSKINITKFDGKKKILKSLQTNNKIDKDFKDAMNSIIRGIIDEKIKKPKSWYTFPKLKLTEIEIAEWYEATETFYHFAKRYEVQERGNSCSVDRAYRNYLIPECKRLLNKIKGLGIN